MTSLPELLNSFRHSAWRLEARDDYDISEEREQFDEFQATGQSTPSQDDLEWQSWVRSVRASQRTIGRVRLVGQPLTPYTQFEMAYYPELVAAGEEVRILDRARVGGRQGPWHRDFWVFDGRDVAVMHYNDVGAFLGVELIDRRDAQPYLDLRDDATTLSVPLADYQWPEERSRVA